MTEAALFFRGRRTDTQSEIFQGGEGADKPAAIPGASCGPQGGRVEGR